MRTANAKWHEVEVDEDENDAISPAHYKQGDVECIDAIRSALNEDELSGYFKGNVLKYVWRENHANGIEDLKKAAWYLEQLIQLSE